MCKELLHVLHKASAGSYSGLCLQPLGRCWCCTGWVIPLWELLGWAAFGWCPRVIPHWGNSAQPGLEILELAWQWKARAEPGEECRAVTSPAADIPCTRKLTFLSVESAAFLVHLYPHSPYHGCPSIMLPAKDQSSWYYNMAEDTSHMAIYKERDDFST